MEKVLRKQLPKLYRAGMTFMQDNASIHNAKVIKKYLRAMGIATLKWPPYSPDLNPIEHMWRILKDRIKRQHPYLESMGDSETAFKALIKACQQEWKAIKRWFMRALIRSMPRRMQAVIAAKGWQTKY